MTIFRTLARTMGWGEKAPQVRAGLRVYAVGDVHGRRDLLDIMLERIAADLAAAPAARTIMVFVGDLVDRGPDSAGVIERLRTLALPGVEPVFLLGNHEEALLRLLDGEAGLLDNWLRFGGDTLAASYGVDPAALARLDEAAAARLLRAAVPADHIAFVRGFRDSVAVDDYLFVHAGIRPGIPLEQQAARDLHWMREPFLSDERRHERVVVHGHTIVDQPEDRGNRIAIDTGAYRTGRLTAVALEGTSRRFLVADAGGSACRSGV